MIRLEEIVPGARVRGIAGPQFVEVLAARSFGPDAVEVTGLSPSAGLVQRSIAGFVDQSTALALGTALTLAGVGLRIGSKADRRP